MHGYPQFEKKRRLGATRAFFRFCILHPERAKVQKEHHKKLAAVVGSAGKHESGGLISVAAIRFLLIRGSLFKFLGKKKLGQLLVQIEISQNHSKP
jgi:hypothetical protein